MFKRLISFLAVFLLPFAAVSQDAIIGGGWIGGAGTTPSGPCTGSACMVSPLLVWNQALVQPSTSATDNIPGLPIGTVSGAYQTIQARTFTPIAVAGTLSNLAVQAQTSPSPGTYGFTLFHGSGTTESSTNLGCNAANGNAIASTTICNDSTHSVTASPGDTFSFQIVPASTPAAINFDVSALFTSTVGQEAPLFAGSSNTAATGTPTGTTTYYGFGHQTVSTTSESVVSSIMPNAGTIDRLYVYASSAPGASNNWVLTVNHETAGNCAGSVSPTSLSATISGASAQTANDLTSGHAITVAAGDCISLSATVTVGGSAVPTTFILASARFRPSVTNAYPLFADGTTLTLTASTTKFLNSAGYVAAGGEGADATVGGVTPGGVTTTFGPLYALQSATPGASSSVTRTYGLRSSATNESPSCTIAGPSAVSCNNSGTFASAANSVVDEYTTTGSTINATALTFWKTGMQVVMAAVAPTCVTPAAQFCLAANSMYVPALGM